LVNRDGQNPVRSMTPLGPSSFGGIRDRQGPKRVMPFLFFVPTEVAGSAASAIL
jgi:hypothetical protein